MAQKSEKAYRSFIKGLVTEANELTFPDNASIDEQNFVLKRDGSRARRLGIDYEELYNKTATGLTVTDIKEGRQSFHIWNNPGGDTTVSLGIVRIKNRLWFLNMLSTTPSANKKNSGNYITIAGLSNAEIDVSVINNKCVIVSDDLTDPVLLTYNPSTDVVSQTTIDVKVRDIWGVDDGLDVNERPASLSNTHKYNLRNQGWAPSIVTVTGADAIDYTKTVTGSYPSNADQWSLGKVSNPSSADYEKYDPNTLLKNSNSNYQIAKGSYIIDLFNRGASRQTESGVTGLPTDTETGQITTVASYAQRVFYSGIGSSVTGADDRSPNYSGYIFFSKVIQNDEDFGKCYQEADPTDPGINDLVASDGGSAQIPDATRIVKIAASRSSLVIFAENGVWELYGDTGGFFATSFQVSKVSTNGVLNANSIVDVNGTFLYWSKAGIYILTPDNVSGRFAAESLSLTSIQTLFLDIPATGKNNCKGFYDEKENQVRWLYNDSASYSATNYINSYNKELIYDLTLQSWYKNTITSQLNDPFVADYVEIPTYAIQGTEEGVYKATDEVIVTSGDSVVVTTDIGINRDSQFSFLTISNTSFTLSKYKNTQFVDWLAHDNVGIDYSSYLVTGYELFGDIMRSKQIPYVFFYFKRTEDGYTLTPSSTLELNNQSSCKVQAQWGWTDSANSGKWGNEFQAYRLLRNYIPSGASDPFDYGEGVIVTKNKLRGSGKCLSLKISSETGKDMQILGWGHPVVMNSEV